MTTSDARKRHAEKETPVSDAIDRAAEVLRTHEVTHLPAGADDADALARALDAAGLLASPAHDAAVGAEALREAAERIRAVVEDPRWESGRFTEHVLIDAGVERLLNDYADLIVLIEREGGRVGCARLRK